MNDATREAVKTYLSLLYKWNAKMNLTAVKEGDAVERLVKPSMEMVRHFPRLAGLKVFDVGSGGGIPAVILAIQIPGCTFFAIESSKKKFAFLTQVAAALKLSNFLPVNERTETVEGKLEYFESADVVTSRQVDSETVFSCATHLLKPGGRLILHRARDEEYDDPSFNPVDITDNVMSFIKV